MDVETTREVGKAIMDKGRGRYIDAPVSGGRIGAANGTLSFMIGCPDSDTHANRARAIISMMADSKKIFFCDHWGNGLAANINNKYLAGTLLVSIAQAMAIGIRSGVDKNVLAQFIRKIEC